MDPLAGIDRWARESPDRVAHRGGGRELTYGELHERSRALAAHLAHTLSPAAPVAVLGHKEPELLVALTACARAGHPYIPLDASQPAHRVEAVLASSGAALLLTPDRIADVSAGGASPAPRELADGEPFYIRFTSGSTGTPKGIVITRGNVAAFLDWMSAEYPLAPDDVVLDQAAYAFDLSEMSVFPCLAAGGTLFALTREETENPRQLFATLARSALSVWISTPSFAGICLAEPSFRESMLPSLRRVLFCGETLPPAVARRLLERFPRAEVWNTYGPTEATVATTSIRVDAELLDRWPAVPIGYAMPGTRVVIADEALRELPDGERGEILIAGPNVSPGYLGQPALTARAFTTFEQRPAYRTGDWGEARDGLLFCAGRMDGQLKVAGYRVEPGDVEANLCALPGVSSAIVLPVLRDGAAVALTAFVVPHEPPAEGEFAAAAGLRRQLAERLPSYMLPRRIQFLESFPLTPNGKVDRKVLAERLA